jgi:hypothetical protein
LADCLFQLSTLSSLVAEQVVTGNQVSTGQVPVAVLVAIGLRSVGKVLGAVLVLSLLSLYLLIQTTPSRLVLAAQAYPLLVQSTETTVYLAALHLLGAVEVAGYMATLDTAREMVDLVVVLMPTLLLQVLEQLIKVITVLVETGLVLTATHQAAVVAQEKSVQEAM